MPQAGRLDALSAARAVMTVLEAAFTQDDAATRLTFGRLTVAPGVPNTIPDLVRISVDLRHEDGARLDAYRRALPDLTTGAAKPCDATVTELIHTPPVRFDAEVTAAITAAVAEEGGAAAPMISGATHDAAVLAGAVKAGMIFVPCRDGISHRADEFTTERAMFAACRGLSGAVHRLAGGFTQEDA